jgi:hypothetical protein
MSAGNTRGFRKEKLQVYRVLKVKSPKFGGGLQLWPVAKLDYRGHWDLQMGGKVLEIVFLIT